VGSSRHSPALRRRSRSRRSGARHRRPAAYRAGVKGQGLVFDDEDVHGLCSLWFRAGRNGAALGRLTALIWQMLLYYRAYIAIDVNSESEPLAEEQLDSPIDVEIPCRPRRSQAAVASGRRASPAAVLEYWRRYHSRYRSPRCAGCLVGLARTRMARPLRRRSSHERCVFDEWLNRELDHRRASELGRHVTVEGEACAEARPLNSNIVVTCANPRAGAPVVQLLML